MSWRFAYKSLETAFEDSLYEKARYSSNDDYDETFATTFKYLKSFGSGMDKADSWPFSNFIPLNFPSGLNYFYMDITRGIRYSIIVDNSIPNDLIIINYDPNNRLPLGYY